MQELKLIVAGGRDFADAGLLKKEIEAYAEALPDREVSIVSGMARGADLLAYRFAIEAEVEVYTFPADWGQYGKRAGHLRNETMGHFADALLAFWDGQSRGTGHMIQFMRSQGKPVHIVRY